MIFVIDPESNWQDMEDGKTGCTCKLVEPSEYDSKKAIPLIFKSTSNHDTDLSSTNKEQTLPEYPQLFSLSSSGASVQLLDCSQK